MQLGRTQPESGNIEADHFDSQGLRKIGSAVHGLVRACCGWLRGAAGEQAYEGYLCHAKKHADTQPLTAEQFYLDSTQRKYTRPNRCC